MFDLWGHFPLVSFSNDNKRVPFHTETTFGVLYCVETVKSDSNSELEHWMGYRDCGTFQRPL